MKLKRLALAAALAVCASASMAENVVTNVSLIENPDLPGYFTAGFTVQHMKAGSFTDIFNFTPNVEGAVSSRLITGGYTKRTNIDFTSANLGGVSPFVFTPTGPEEIGFSGLLTNFNGLLQLTVSGIAGFGLAAGSPIAASYSGTMNVVPVTAIPEPETYALMLAGLGAVGFMARRRRIS